MAISEREFAQAERRMEERRAAGYVVAARYDGPSARLVVELSNGVELAVPAKNIERLARAEEAELAEIEISPAGLGLHWPKLDADVYVPALLQGVFGSKHWMAALLGAAGGKAASAQKAAAARENGRKGGRPKRIVNA